MKKGVTLLELVVAMGIFSVLSTLMIGAYVSVIRIKTYTSIQVNSQQKVRTATEIITRLAKQANIVEVTSGPTLTLYFLEPGPPPTGQARQFYISGSRLYDSACTTLDVGSLMCTAWQPPIDMLPDFTNVSASFAKDVNTVNKKLMIDIAGTFDDPTFRDTLTLKTGTVLENEK